MYTSPKASAVKRKSGIPRYFLLTLFLCLFTSINVVLITPLVRSHSFSNMSASVMNNVSRLWRAKVPSEDRNLLESVPAKKLKTKSLPKLFHTSGMSPKPTVPMALIIPCQNEDMPLLPLLLESLANQTVYPSEVILVLNIAPTAAEGVLLTKLGSLRSSEENVIKSLMAVNNSAFSSVPAESKPQILKSRAPVEISLAEIPRISIYVRSGVHYAGDNRMFGSKKASSGSKLISFFDCDDYLHPQRTEYLYRTFVANPELEVLIHGFQLIRMSTWNTLFNKFVKKVPYLDGMNITFPLWPYELLQERLPVNAYANLPDGEPTQKKDEIWFYPKGMRLPRYPGIQTQGHNGWITIKKEILKKVPYPVNLRRGQDSLYNWRLLKAKVMFNMLPIKLAAYIRQN